jgi:hypothetical protein
MLACRLVWRTVTTETLITVWRKTGIAILVRSNFCGDNYLGHTIGELNMKRSKSIWLVCGFQKTSVAFRTAILLLLLSGLGFSAQAAFAQTGSTGIFGGGPFYKNAANNIKEIENSGFTEAIVWSVEVKSNGDLNLNGEFPLTSNGSYIGGQTYPDFAGNMAILKQGTVKRVTLSIGSSNVGDWQDITALVKSQGTGPGSILYQDFQSLKNAIPALDAVDFDDENSFDLNTTVQFGVMLGNLGYHVLPDAFNNSSYWMNVVSGINAQLPGTVDGVHLQVYAGGSGNNPCSSTWNFGSVPVFPGLWDRGDTPKQVKSRMSGWNKECGIIGGFMWLYDDFVGNGLAAKYASAMDDAVGIGGFTLSAPETVFLNESSTAKAAIKIVDFGVFKGAVSLALSPLPSGVSAVLTGQGNKQTFVLTASSDAATGFASVKVTGTSGETSQSSTFTLAVSAAAHGKGTGTVVSLSSAFNVFGIYTDGTTYSTGGLDGSGFSYSSKELGKSRVLDLVGAKFGAANQPDAVGCNGQLINLPRGNFSGLLVLGTGVQGNQTAQTIMVNYTDGTSTQLVQSFSDWSSPQNFPGELEAVASSYRNSSNGSKDLAIFNLYAYEFGIDQTKTVQSITLPNNPNVVVLGATLLGGDGPTGQSR